MLLGTMVRPKPLKPLKGLPQQVLESTRWEAGIFIAEPLAKKDTLWCFFAMVKFYSESGYICAEAFASCAVPQALDRLFLDLPDAFACEVEACSNLFEGKGLFAVEAEIE